MPSRKDNIKLTQKKLNEAFERLKAGVPINICGKYNISPSKVEEEAGLSRSIILGPAHKDILSKIKSYKAEKCASERGLSSETELLNEKIKNIRAELASEKEKRKALQVKIEAQEGLFIKQLGVQIDMLDAVMNEVPKHRRKDLNRTLESAMTSKPNNTNVIVLKPKKKR